MQEKQSPKARGLSPQDLRRNFAQLLSAWANYENEKPVGWLIDQWETRLDPEVIDCAMDAIEDAHDDERRAKAMRALEPIVARGLVRRMGRFIAAPAIIEPEMLEDWTVWLCVRLAYESLGGEVSEVECKLWGEHFHLAVCTSCTAVFRPTRRIRQASRCHLCRHRPAAAAFGSPETLRAFAANEPITIRVPKKAGSVVLSWKYKTMIRCPELPRASLCPSRRCDLWEACMQKPPSSAPDIACQCRTSGIGRHYSRGSRFVLGVLASEGDLEER